MTAFLQCNLCKRLIAGDDRDAVREGVNGEGARVDVCGSCMREAAERVAERLRASVKVVDPMPRSVQARALEIRLPEHLTRRR